MLTAEEIRSRTFLVSLRGYDREEVAAFLDEVADQVSGLVERLEQSDAKVSQAEEDKARAEEAVADKPAAEAEPAPAAAQPAPENPFAEIGQETQRILEAAQQAGDEMRAKAREEADRELKAARAQADRIIAEGERRREDMERTVQALEDAREKIADDFRGLGRTVEEVLRELAPDAGASTMREAIAEAARDDDRQTDEEAESVAEEAPPGDVVDEAVVGEDIADDEPDVVALREVADDEPAVPDAGEVVDDERVVADGHPVVDEEPAEVADDDPQVVDAPVEALPEKPTEALEDEAPVEAAVRDDEWRFEDEPEVSQDADEAIRLVQTRTEALMPLHPKLVRRLKRGLQDIQNTTLDLLRRDTDHDDPERFLPEEPLITSLGETTREFLEAAYVAGHREGMRALGDEEAASPTDSDHPLADDLSLDLAVRITDDLREQLTLGFERGEDLAALSERVEEVFARLREGPVGDVGAVALVSAYEWGLHDAWRDREVDARRWVLAVEPPCEDPRCVENVNAGSVPLDDSFPSGHRFPPARPGCNCTTVPHT